MFIIGIDPHKGSRTAAVIDRDRDRLLAWAAPFEPRVWAVEGAAVMALGLVALLPSREGLTVDRRPRVDGTAL